MALHWKTFFFHFVPALLLLAWSGHFIGRSRRSAGWPRVPATMVESRVVRRGNGGVPHLAFDYAVGAQRHVGRRLWVGPRVIQVSGTWAEGVVARYPLGSAVQVAVDPADARYAVLEPGVRAVHWLPGVGGVLMLALGLAFAAVFP